MRLFYATVSLFSRCMFKALFGVRVTGMDRLPKTGPLLICSNHRSNLDPPLLGGFLKREVHFFAKAELFRNRLAGRLLRKLNAFPVRRGQLDKSAMSACMKILGRSNALVFFPEGTRAPADGFLVPKFGVGWILRKTRADVLPIYLHGTANAKLFRFPRPQLEIVIGETIPAEVLISDSPDDKSGYQTIANRILEAIRSTSRFATLSRIDYHGNIFDRDVIDDERLR
ncbi:1-acyl-sn-glycerol-3-phosphate acyltransferase [bacterium]|nr:1-acyl-sn-glycerol-3-phosphate acyltransferase [bacterium]